MGAVIVALAALTLAAEVVAGPVREGRADRPEAALAINVVWGTPYVLPMAKTLQREGARATFFLGGRWAEAHPEIVRELVALGMEIGNHGFAHRHVGGLDLRRNLEEIRRAERAIAAAGGGRTRLYAPAFGELAPAVLRAAHELGYRTVMWSADTIDWRPWHSADIIAARALRGLRPGAIILMHPTSRTLAALPGILEGMRARGLKAVTVSRLIEAPLAPVKPAQAGVT